MAFQPRPAEGSNAVTLTDFEGNDVTITLEAGQNAVGTAQLFYSRARRREARLVQAAERESELLELLADAQQQLAELPALPTARLLELVADLPAERAGQFRTLPGIRATGPHGFTVIVGRNARDNDQVTFGIARSRDVWLHVQGYRGSHVIIQAQNRAVPFDTIVFAAELAAGHSQAADSSNVPVDYTLRKNVWRVRGGAAGAVHFTAQKTLYVTPRKRAEADQDA
jgi:predicted ribosome quality control (RQC) complex YloA/Tae2 family protein